MLVCIIAAMFFFCGCAAKRVNLTENGMATINRSSSENVIIRWADAYQDGNDLLIEGVIERPLFSTGPLKVHIDATIFSADEIKLREGSTEVIYVPGHKIGKGVSWERFSIRIPEVQPQRLKIEVAVKPGEHGEMG